VQVSYGVGVSVRAERVRVLALARRAEAVRAGVPFLERCCHPDKGPCPAGSRKVVVGVSPAGTCDDPFSTAWDRRWVVGPRPCGGCGLPIRWSYDARENEWSCWDCGGVARS